VEEKRRWVKVSLRRETYERLRAFAESHGLTSLNDAIELLLTTVSSKVSRRRTMLDILRDVKVQLLSEVGPRDPDRFVARARSLGAVVIEGGKDVALVDPDFWAFFKENLHNLPKRIEDVRDVALRKLVTFMREEGLIYYDAIKKRWLFVDNTVAIG